jgi:hypothetical protein
VIHLCSLRHNALLSALQAIFLLSEADIFWKQSCGGLVGARRNQF